MTNKLLEKDKKVFSFIKQKIINNGKNPTLKEINKITGGQSPRSASLVVDRLVKARLIKRAGRGEIILLNENHDNSVSTREIPLIGNVSCGGPSYAEQNIQDYLSISTNIAKTGFNYFLLRATGDSMNKAGINSGDLLLVREQSTAENGEKIVALIDDEATVKFFEKKDNYIVLRPSSTNKNHKPIVLTENCQIQGVVQEVLPADLTI